MEGINLDQIKAILIDPTLSNERKEFALRAAHLKSVAGMVAIGCGTLTVVSFISLG